MPHCLGCSIPNRRLTSASCDETLNDPPIPFNKPFLSGNETKYIDQAHQLAQLAGDGYFTEKCHLWLERYLGSPKALLTHSCTAALEMAALLAEVGPGDEIIMPSFTFVSTANAFVLRGATPVFVDIRPDTLNLDECLVSEAITPQTKAIVAVHYAGVGCEMNALAEIAEQHNVLLIEDSAQGLCASYHGRPLGTLGHLATFSFHETKNVISGEGGALLINNERLTERAEVIREKGTNRSQFFRGEVNKYKWVDIGSSYLPGELTAAFLFAQLEKAEEITQKRRVIWNKYQSIFEDLEEEGKVRRPIIPKDIEHNGHIYYLLLDHKYNRDDILKKLVAKGIHAVFHYQPLHSSPAGKRYGVNRRPLLVTEDISERLIRLPIWIGFDKHGRVQDELKRILFNKR